MTIDYDTMEWEDAPTFNGFAKFSDIGDSYTGIVRAHHPTEGATTYQGEDCGFVDIEDNTGATWRITLDKGTLRDPINAIAAQRGNQFVDRTALKITYTEDVQSKSNKGWTYKNFKIASTLVVAGSGSIVDHIKNKADSDDEKPF